MQGIPCLNPCHSSYTHNGNIDTHANGAKRKGRRRTARQAVICEACSCDKTMNYPELFLGLDYTYFLNLSNLANLVGYPNKL